jgi:hypothetical protein
MHQGCRGGERDGESFLAGGKSKGEPDMGLASAGVAKRYDVLAAQDELTAGEFPAPASC